MPLFSKKDDQDVSGRAGSANRLPITQLDLSLRYDIYASDINEDRVYENVRINGMKTLDKADETTGFYVEGWLEIETDDGVRMLIRPIQIDHMCEAGVIPKYRSIPRPTESTDKSKEKPA
jgi:hypothetical protein